MSEDSDDAPIGYRKPPRASQFTPGMSGNPRGRPAKLTRQRLPHERALMKLITINEGGRFRQVPIGKAFLMKLQHDMQSGDPFAYELWQKFKKDFGARGAFAPPIRGIEFEYIFPDPFRNVLIDLGIIERVDPYGPNTRWLVRPTYVQAALKRMEHPLTLADQKIVWEATNNPKKVKWPEWWSYAPPKPKREAKKASKRI